MGEADGGYVQVEGEREVLKQSKKLDDEGASLEMALWR